MKITVVSPAALVVAVSAQGNSGNERQVVVHVDERTSVPFLVRGQAEALASEEGLALGRKAAEIARSAHNTLFTMYTLPHYAISLAAAGEYARACEVFAEARAFGRKYGVIGPLARVISFEAGMHLSLFDFEGAEALQRKSRELAAGADCPQPFISSGVDLLFTLARTGNPGAAETLLKDTAAAAVAHPWHRGIWEARLSQARAELALARQDRSLAIEEAATAVVQSHALPRPKYEALALITSARTLGELHRTHEAAGNARRAIAFARRTGDPALLLSALDVLLALDGDDASLAEARTLVSSITATLATADETMRSRFVTSETVRRIQTLSSFLTQPKAPPKERRGYATPLRPGRLRICRLRENILIARQS
jgi:ATP/maltotriose-dependent transcriptional regulator MalT